ncbi:MAG: DUF3887 domain-containing protein [Candidatus Coatesbacteria bacterium]|nr:DUF3887 domain-containing protein [Candidatus Coatesbacteria bacterium]
MKKWIGILFIAIMLVSCKTKAEEKKADANINEDITALAKKVANAVIKDDYDAVSGYFDDEVKKGLPKDKFSEASNGLKSRLGGFKNITKINQLKQGDYDVVLVTTEFEKATIDIKVVFNKNKQVAGLFFLPGQAANIDYKNPSYVKIENIVEKDVTVGKGEWELKGKLTLPKDAKSVPAVVLVHGSGPNDMDETILSNKPFKDIALGLASKGIAVLRYNKRTNQHKEKIIGVLKELTVKEETIDDAILAVELLRSTEGIDKNRIFVLGHSLGGMLIPRIGLASQNIKGLISLAGSTRPMEDLMLEQITYIYSLDGTLAKDEKEHIEKLKQEIAKLKQLDKNAKDDKPVLGAFSKYWIDLKDYKPHEVAKNLKQPLYILQGERDYQVTMVDFNNWKESLKNNKNVYFKSYPSLNHLFFKGTGKSTPEEYSKADHVDEQLLNDIVEWIKKIK